MSLTTKASLAQRTACWPADWFNRWGVQIPFGTYLFTDFFLPTLSSALLLLLLSLSWQRP